MVIHQATFADLADLTELFDLYRIFYGQKGNLVKAKNFMKDRLRNEDSIIFLAFDEKRQSAGFLQLYPSFSSVSMKRLWILNDLYVRKSARGKGYGEQLINKAIAFAEKTGSKGLLLETALENTTAQKLYERVGFNKETSYLYFYPTLQQ